MFKDIFVHVCILVSFLFSGSLVFRNNPSIMNFRKKIIMGILTGLLGVLLMEFSIGIQKGTFIDLRHIAIVTAAFLGGTTASLIAAIIIGVVRLLYSEINNMIIAITVITILVGLLVGEIKRLKISPFYQWLFMIILSTFLYSIF